MNRFVQIYSLTLLLLTASSSAMADGMMLTAPSYIIYETAQQALITYDQDTSSESITILPSFRGDTGDFAWVLPVPSQPVVQEGNSRFFQELRTLTGPRYKSRDGEWDCGNRQTDLVGAPLEDGVEIIESQLVGYYQTMTLAADQAPALLDSLTQWGFLHADNIEQATTLITSYVEQDWFFVTVKMDSTAFAEVFPYEQDYYFGQLEPLTLTFSSDEVIYPMRISALSADESSKLNLYIIADHRMDFPGAATRYANRFTPAEYNDLNSRLSLRQIIHSGDFLTLLTRIYDPNDMTEDITIVRAPTDDEYLLIYYSGVPWMVVFLWGPPALWGFYRWLSRKRKDARLCS